MNLYQHENYDEYRRVQRKMTAQKTAASKKGQFDISWVSEAEMEAVNHNVHIYLPKINIAVCHGCRSGFEMRVLQRLNPDALIYGTDLTGVAYEGPHTYFREMDFNHLPRGWVEYFDLIYSNSIDHSWDPRKTLSMWALELRMRGICYITFHCGNKVTREDCSFLDAEKYEDEINSMAEATGLELLYISPAYISKYQSTCVDTMLRRIA